MLIRLVKGACVVWSPVPSGKPQAVADELVRAPWTVASPILGRGLTGVGRNGERGGASTGVTAQLVTLFFHDHVPSQLRRPSASSLNQAYIGGFRKNRLSRPGRFAR